MCCPVVDNLSAFLVAFGLFPCGFCLAPVMQVHVYVSEVFELSEAHRKGLFLSGYLYGVACYSGSAQGQDGWNPGFLGV